MSKVKKQGKEAVERLTDGLEYAPKNGAVLVDSKDLKVLMEYIAALEATNGAPEKHKYRVILIGEWYSTNVGIELSETELALMKQIEARSNPVEPSLMVVPYIEDDPAYAWPHIAHV